jgi:transcriptional repressor NrdR
MRCPFCNHEDTQVKDSRPSEDGSSIRRRRYCPSCESRFTTFERVQLRELTVLKSNGEKRVFDREKIAKSMAIALRKRPVEAEQVEMAINRIVQKLESEGESDIATKHIGSLVMSELKNSMPSPISATPASTAISPTPRISRPSSKNSSMQHDAQFLAHAARMAARGLGRTAPNPSVGCVLVKKNNEVIAAARTGDGGRPHAEAIALASAGTAAARGATAYVTLEPCAHHGVTPPCAQALIDAGIARVVIAANGPRPARQLAVASRCSRRWRGSHQSSVTSLQ